MYDPDSLEDQECEKAVEFAAFAIIAISTACLVGLLWWWLL